MSKQTLGVKTQGNAITVYVDPITDRPISISQFDEEPAGGFPKIYSREEVRAAFPQYEVKFIEGQHAAPPEADVYAVSDEEIDKVDREGRAQLEAAAAKQGVKLPPRKGGVLSPVPELVQPSAPRPAFIQPIPPASLIPANIEQELRTMLAKRQVATGKAKKELDQEINHVFNFIVRLEPASRDHLRALADSYREQSREDF